MDIEHISADGIPLNIADTQARQDITEIKSNLTELITFADEEEQAYGTNTANCINIAGLKIQWGTQQCTANAYTRITFKEAFKNNGYVAFASYIHSNQQAIQSSNASITNLHTEYADIRSAGGMYGWVCIGF